ncbi:MAG: sodium:calcium antiporter [Bacillota bacterium]
MFTALYLAGGLVLILAGAEMFTNGVEWVGKKWRISEGAVGSILAAVGTALPESMIPVMAFIFGSGKESVEVGTGAILGAPFMLATLALAVTGIAGLAYRVNGRHRKYMLIDRSTVRRDLAFFLAVYSLAILAAFVPLDLRWPVVLSLVLAYVYYVVLTLKGERVMDEDGIKPLYFARKRDNPASALVLLQVGAALAGIVAGARFFVVGVEHAASLLDISPFVLSIFIAPIATELPEKVNSLIWVRRGKDTLALGNITGAMVFQGSIIPAFAIAATPWQLSGLAMVSALLALAGAGLVYVTLRLGEGIRPMALVMNGSLYIAFVAAAALISQS